MAISVTIGKKSYDLPDMSFAATELAWPYVTEATAQLDAMKATGAGLRIIAAVLLEDESFDASLFGITETGLTQEQTFDKVTYFLKKQLKAKEINQVPQAVLAMLIEAELIEKEGTSGEEDGLQTLATLFEGIAPDTSLNLLQPDAKEEAGIL